MKLFFTKDKLTMNLEQLLRKVGYFCIRDRKTGSESMVRRLDNNFYPRFHVYIEYIGDRIVLNLHLDQKQPRYEGARAHNADYDGEVVEREAKRIKNFIIEHLQLDQNNKISNNIDLLNKILPKQFDVVDEVNKKEKKKSWWRKIFNLD